MTPGESGAPPEESAAPADPGSAATLAPPAPPRSARYAGLAQALRALGTNLRTSAALVLLLRRPLADLRTGPVQLCLLFALRLLLDFSFDLYSVGMQGGQADPLALPAVAFWAPAALFSSWLIATLCVRAELAAYLAVAAFGLACWEACASALVAFAADRLPGVARLYDELAWAPLAWCALAYGVAAVRAAQLPRRRQRIGIFLLAGALVLLSALCVDPSLRLWVPAGSAAGDADSPDAVQSEQTLYAQYDLLGDALDAISPGQDGVTELFTVSFGGDGAQDVFLNEAAGADAVMAEVFDSGEHSLVLANSQAHPQERPFATVSALQRALATLAERMNEDDILALFLTSHGTADHHLVVSLPPYHFEDLTPERLRALLDDAGIRYRVIIVSACYAGGFVAPLAGPDTMVIAASDADSTSFGCRDGAQWTDFGRAYFAEALAQSASFEGAFRIASRRIAEREAQEHLPPSSPQIWVGSGIRNQLQRLETRSGGKILFAARSGAGRFP